MHPRLVRDYLTEWLKKSVMVGVERELKVPRRKDKIVSVIGPRRAGKTYYFYQLIREDREGSLYLNLRYETCRRRL